MRSAESRTLLLFPLEGTTPAPPKAVPPAPSSSTCLVAPAERVERSARAELEQLVARVNDYAADVRARATRRAYATDFRAFDAWCAAHGL